MPLQIVRNDITKIECDAVVNAANNSLLGGGGVDGAIHRAAGPALLKECRTLGGCETGKAKITGGYNMPCRYIIHTVGPIWYGGKCGEKELLISCYNESLELAKKHGCESVAFPLISAGVYGYPAKEAFEIARNTVIDFLNDNDMLVYIVVFDKNAFSISKALENDIKSYIDDNYADVNYSPRAKENRRIFGSFCFNDIAECEPVESSFQSDDVCESSASDTFDSSFESELGAELESLDESFSEMLLRKIDEKGMTDAECYKKANIDRKLFSKIRNDKYYKPSKPTVLAFVIALELPLSEAGDMLLKAGYALSHSSKFDVIVEYFIKNGKYNIYDINEALFAFDQNLIGA